MPRFAANLSWLFAEQEFEARFAAAAAAGFTAVEFLFPYAYSPEQLARWQREAGVQTVLFNLPPGEWANGERGLAAQPGRELDFAASVELALLHARALGVTRLHAMAGLTDPGLPRSLQHHAYVQNLRRACRRLAPYGIELLIEPINTGDMPHYFLTHVAQALGVIAEVGEPNLRLQFDAYHVHRVDDEVSATFAAALPHIAHIQIAGSPGRNEPDTGELDYRSLFDQIDAAGFAGWVGCEYRPSAGTLAGLHWRERLITR